MTNQADTLVAVTVGYTRHETPAFEQKHLFRQPHYWLAPGSGEWEREPPPFDSAPTYETDGIVLEWVQSNWQTHMKKWDKALFRMWRLKFPQVDERKYLFMNYRVGDYAQALLAIQEERDG